MILINSQLDIEQYVDPMTLRCKVVYKHHLGDSVMEDYLVPVIYKKSKNLYRIFTSGKNTIDCLFDFYNITADCSLRKGKQSDIPTAISMYDIITDDENSAKICLYLGSLFLKNNII